MSNVLTATVVVVNSDGTYSITWTGGTGVGLAFTAPTSAALAGLVFNESRNGANYVFVPVTGAFVANVLSGNLGAKPGVGITLTLDVVTGSTIVSDSGGNATLGQTGVTVVNSCTAVRTAKTLANLTAIPSDYQLGNDLRFIRFKLTVTATCKVNTYINNFNGTQSIRCTSDDTVAMAIPSGGWMHTGAANYQGKEMLSLAAGTYTVTIQNFTDYAFLNSGGTVLDVIDGGTVTVSPADDAGTVFYAVGDTSKVRTTATWGNTRTFVCTGIPYILCTYFDSAGDTIDVYLDRTRHRNLDYVARLAEFKPAPTVNLQTLLLRLPADDYVDDGQPHEWTVYVSSVTQYTVWTVGGTFRSPPVLPTQNFILYSDSRGDGLSQSLGIMLNKVSLNNSTGGRSVATGALDATITPSLDQTDVTDIVIQLGVNDGFNSTLPDLATLYDKFRNGISGHTGYSSASGVRMWHLEEYTFDTAGSVNTAIRTQIAALGETNSRMLKNAQLWGNWADGSITLSPGNVHPNSAGYAVLATRIANIIKGYEAFPAYTISGATSGDVSSPSGVITVAMSGVLLFDATQGNQVTLTASDGTIDVTAVSGTITGDNTIAPATTPADLAKTFTLMYTPATSGVKTITPSNNSGWDDPDPFEYQAESESSAGVGMFDCLIGSGIF